VQILVVVANTQVRTLSAEVEKGFLTTVVDQELVGPKSQVNSVKWIIFYWSTRGAGLGWSFFGRIPLHLTLGFGRLKMVLTSKGNQLNIPEPHLVQKVARH